MRLVSKILVQSLAILALSAALALAANTARKDPLPASPQPQKSSVQLDGQEIGVKDAAMLFITGRAVFLDARSAFEFAQGHIQVGVSQALTLPESAVVLRDGSSFVFEIQAEDRVAQRKVETGRRGEGRVEILSGLSAGERVAVDPLAAARSR